MEKTVQVVLGTAGHIDHGKTSLVQALTGVNTDRLAEEQARGMTIDLGFAFLDEKITIVDVPGHEKFIRNMVAGVATIDIALIVIAADDGIMPQTLEHLYIMHILGIQRGIVALTKTDLASDEEWLSLIEEEIDEILNETTLAGAPIIRVSALTGLGIEDLRQTIISVAAKCRRETDRGYFRLPIDRVFSKAGFGTVVTGTVISGKGTVGESLTILPENATVKIRGIQSHGASVNEVRMGDRAAINVTGAEKNQFFRGSELSSPGRSRVSDRFVGTVEILPNSKWVVKPGQRLRFHYGTTEVLGRIWIPESRLKAGEKTKAVVTLEKSVPITMDDRFIIRSYSPMETLGGGRVLDPTPGGGWKELKETVKNIPVDLPQRWLWFIRNDYQHPRSLEEWSVLLQQSPEKIQSWIDPKQLTVDEQANLVYHLEDRKKSEKAVTDLLAGYHRENPYRKFMGRKQLADALGFSSKWYDLIIQSCLQSKRIVAMAAGYALADHSINITDVDNMRLNEIYTNLKNGKFEPVTTADLTGRFGWEAGKTLELVHVLKGQLKLVEIAGGLWLSDDGLNLILTELKQWFTKNNTLSVAEFKTMTGLTRKSIIPLLEYLDKQQITDRDGDVRVASKNMDTVLA